jgi:hypothetical protein
MRRGLLSSSLRGTSSTIGSPYSGVHARSGRAPGSRTATAASSSPDCTRSISSIDLAASTCSSSAGCLALSASVAWISGRTADTTPPRCTVPAIASAAPAGRQQLVVLRQQPAHLRHQRAARLVEHHGLALALEQRAAQLAFQRSHLLAHRRLRQRHPRGRRRERSFARHGGEGAQDADAAHARMLNQCFSVAKGLFAFALARAFLSWSP